MGDWVSYAPRDPIHESFEKIIDRTKTEIREKYKEKVIKFYDGTNKNIENLKVLYAKFSQDFEDEKKIRDNILKYVINSGTKNFVGVNLFEKIIEEKKNKSYDIAGFGSKPQKEALLKEVQEFNTTMENAYNDFKNLQTTTDFDSEKKTIFDKQLEKEEQENQSFKNSILKNRDYYSTNYYDKIKNYGKTIEKDDKTIEKDVFFDKNYFEYIILGQLDIGSENYNYYFYNDNRKNSVYNIEEFAKNSNFDKYHISSNERRTINNTPASNLVERGAFPVIRSIARMGGGKYKQSKTAKKRATRKHMKKRTYRSRRSRK